MYSEKTPDDGQRNCPKHVEFYSKNKFGKLVHPVGFSIRIYHDARSPERHTQGTVKTNNCTPRTFYKTRNWAPKNESSEPKHLELKCFTIKIFT